MDADTYYQQATKRNIGIVTPEQQQQLRRSRVAIVGMGGGGGIYLNTLLRMGIGRFHIADFDTFDVVNINRQAGAMNSTFGRPKVQVMAEMARDIHPGVDIQEFGEGISLETIDAFLQGVDVAVDALDVFAHPARLLLYSRARAKGIPVLFGIPPGLSATLSVFMPDGPSFEDYFDFREGMTPMEIMAAFMAGLTPAGTHWSYYDTSRVDPASQAAPSSAASMSILAGLIATEVQVILLGTREPLVIPQYLQFDAFKVKLKTGRLRWGNRGPLQRLKRWLIVRRLSALAGAFNGAGFEPLPSAQAKP